MLYLILKVDLKTTLMSGYNYYDTLGVGDGWGQTVSK